MPLIILVGGNLGSAGRRDYSDSARVERVVGVKCCRSFVIHI